MPDSCTVHFLPPLVANDTAEPSQQGTDAVAGGTLDTLDGVFNAAVGQDGDLNLFAIHEYLLGPPAHGQADDVVASGILFHQVEARGGSGGEDRMIGVALLHLCQCAADCGHLHVIADNFEIADIRGAEPKSCAGDTHHDRELPAEATP